MAVASGSLDSTYSPLPDEQDVDTPLRQHSSRLLRAASTTLTGGAAVLPPPPAARSDAITPPRRPNSRRDVRRSQVPQRVLEDLLHRYRYRIILFSGAIVMLALTMLCLFVWVVYAEASYNRLPCDQPLQYFVCVSLMVGQVKQFVLKRFSPQRVTLQPWIAVIIGVFAAIPGWMVIWWGLHMIDACRTCQKTNPGLYYPTKYFIYAQILLCILITPFFSIGFTAVLMFLSRIKDRPTDGCEEAVHKLPRVPSDSPELVDAEDGRVMECPICLGTLSSVIVRTGCDHYFHESCLATWCKSHLDCPLCRAQVGAVDGNGVNISA